MIICYTVPEIWCMMNVTVIFHFGVFLPFYPLNSLKKSKFKKMKRQVPRDIIIYKSVPKIMIICYTSWDMACDGCNCHFFILGYFLPFYPLTAKKIKITKKWKERLRYRHFTHVYQKLWSDDDGSWDMVCNRRMDRQIDGWTGGKKWHKEVGAHLKNIYFFIKL